MTQPEVIAHRYRVERAVGRGGMGTVWLCSDETLHRQVAVKQVGSLPGESPGDTARAMREARLAAALNHKNAVSIYDVVEHSGTTWLVMEYVPSRTLSQLISAEGRLTPMRAAHIGAQVAAALSSAHSLGIIHRDIKPGNILVTDGNAAKISDFGIARGHQDMQLTQTGMVTGTPAFFSPELARGDDPTFASDVWAFGVTLYIATEGGPPYEPRSNPLAMLSAIVSETLPPPTRAGPLTPVLAAMLHRDASQRLTMAQTLAALDEVERVGRRPQSWDAATIAASTPARLDRPDDTTVVDAAGEPAYERAVAVPAVDGASWSSSPVEREVPPAPRRSLVGPAVLAVLALLVLVGAGALLLDTLDLGADGGTASGSPNPNGAGGTPVGKQGRDTPSGNGGTNSTQAPDEPATTAPSSEPTTTAPSSEPTTDPTDDASTSISEDPTTPPSESASTADAEAFTQSYFDTVVSDRDAAWSLLAPSMQKQRTSFDDFWGQVESVDVLSVDAIDEASVRYQIEYRFTDGSESIETKLLTLQPYGSSYLITSDSPSE